MLGFDDWSDEESEEVEDHDLRLVTATAEGFDTARDRAAAIVPCHYASPGRLAHVFEKLGKPAVGKLLRTKLPETKSIRSGDLGEILATEYIDENTGFSAPIKRLRWKDHREMSMRGEDVIGVSLPDEDKPIHFLKVEAKSEGKLSTRTVTNAREALNGGNGLPSSHAVSFVSERLHEMGREELADAIDDAQLKEGITRRQVTHMLFTFSGNAPDNFLRTDLENYDGRVDQLSVGLRITPHQDFIKAVFEKVLEANGA